MEFLRRLSTRRVTRSSSAETLELVGKIFQGEPKNEDAKSKSASDAEVVEILGRIFGGELEHLKQASPTVESSTQKIDTLPRTATGFKSPSSSLYETEYSEINRTMMSALALKWILHGDYESFTREQDVKTKLLPETFAKLQKDFKGWLKTTEDIFDLLVALVTSDLGKDPAILEQLKKRQLIPAEEANHDTIVYIAALNDDFPTLAGLPKKRREDILLGIRFAASVNIPQLVQAECVPGSLKDAEILKDRPRARELKCMEILLDVAGAFGDRDVRGAVTMTESVVGGYRAAFEGLSELLEGRSPLRKCYQSILKYRKDLLRTKDYTFSCASPAEEHAYLRLLCMGRVDNSYMGHVFKDAFDGLEAAPREALINGLNVDGVDDGVAVLPYYMPGLLSLGLRSRSTLEREAVVNILSSLFRFLARVLGGTKPVPQSEGRIIERSVAFARNVVGSEKFVTEPNILDELEIPYPPISSEAANEVTNGS